MRKMNWAARMGGFVLGGVLMVVLTGCWGYVGGPVYSGPGPYYYDDGPYYWGGVDVYGGYDRGHYDHDAGQRGAASRGAIAQGHAVRSGGDNHR